MGPDRIDNTVVSDSLPAFLAEAPKVGHCFRCLSPVDPATDEWAAIAQADSKVGNEYLVGGVLCETCVGAWREWVGGCDE